MSSILAVGIDTSGRWWRGDGPEDLHEYLRECTADGYPVGAVRDCVCECGSIVFGLRADRNEGTARRTCRACGVKRFVADSEEYWEDAEPRTCTCPCRGKDFNIAVGFSLRDDGDVRWITVAQRCAACGVLGSYVDWKVDYSPTEHLLNG